LSQNHPLMKQLNEQVQDADLMAEAEVVDVEDVK
jgi:hypothetical protein